MCPRRGRATVGGTAVVLGNGVVTCGVWCAERRTVARKNHLSSAVDDRRPRTNIFRRTRDDDVIVFRRPVSPNENPVDKHGFDTGVPPGGCETDGTKQKKKKRGVKNITYVQNNDCYTLPSTETTARDRGYRKRTEFSPLARRVSRNDNMTQNGRTIATVRRKRRLDGRGAGGGQGVSGGSAVEGARLRARGEGISGCA